MAREFLERGKHFGRINRRIVRLTDRKRAFQRSGDRFSDRVAREECLEPRARFRPRRDPRLRLL